MKVMLLIVARALSRFNGVSNLRSKLVDDWAYKESVILYHIQCGSVLIDNPQIFSILMIRVRELFGALIKIGICSEFYK